MQLKHLCISFIFCIFSYCWAFFIKNFSKSSISCDSLSSGELGHREHHDAFTDSDDVLSDASDMVENLNNEDKNEKKFLVWNIG